jgi:hypothetical protein
MAARIYRETPLDQQKPKKRRLAEILSVSLRIVEKWVSRIDKDNKEKRDIEIRKLWLACHIQEEIAEAMACRNRESLMFYRKSKLFVFR